MTEKLYGDDIWKSRCDELEARLAAVEDKLLQEVNPESEAVDKSWPQDGDKYFFLHPDGDNDIYVWDNDLIDKTLQARGNVYLTGEEAKKADQLCLAMNEFRAAAKKAWDTQGKTPDVIGDSKRYFAYYLSEIRGWDWFSLVDGSLPGSVYFPTPESAIEAAKAVDAKYPGVLR